MMKKGPKYGLPSVEVPSVDFAQVSARIQSVISTIQRHDSEVVILPEQGKVLLSQIFNWYERDFGGKRQVFNFLLDYLDPDDKAEYLARNMDHIKVEYLFYDWNLNH